MFLQTGNCEEGPLSTVLTILKSKNDSVKASIRIYKQIRIHVLWIRICNIFRCLWQFSLNIDKTVDLFQGGGRVGQTILFSYTYQSTLSTYQLAEKLKGGQAAYLYDPVNKNLDKNLGFYFVWKIILNGTRSVCRHFCLNIIDVASF
jgi:hypothetical protein